MDTGVREILVKALNQSAERNRLQGDWGMHFPKAWALGIFSYSRSGLIFNKAAPEFVDCIERLYTPAEILAILAVARFEGIWRPE